MKDIFEGGKKLPLIDEFYTLQGEGNYFGSAAYFIRIGGCDIGCHFCDTKYSWKMGVDQLMDIEKIIDNVKQTEAQILVVTGGEPLLYNLDPIGELIEKNNLKAHLETSGAHKMSGKWDWVCLSPKKNAPPLQENIKAANELKIIVFDDSDFQWAEKYADLVDESCFLYLQPEWSRRNTMTLKIVEYIKKHPKWRLSIQAHKYIKIP